jgi:hypothetical protein
MYRAYLDESAEKQDAVFAVGGFVGPENEWLALEPDWIAALPNGVEYFHATECFGGHDQFKGMHISGRQATLDKLTDLIVGRNIRLIAGVIDVAAYRDVAPRRLENEFLGSKCAPPFGAAVEYACQSMNRPNEPFPQLRIFHRDECL